MSQGRGCAGQAAVAIAALLMCLLVYVDGAAYTVGDSGGWSFNAGSWAKGKRFRAGDTLSK